MSMSTSGAFRTVEGKHEGPVLPNSIQELTTLRVSLAPNTKVTGGIVCCDLELKHSDFQIDGPVCALKSASVDLSGDRVGEFGGGIVVGANIAVRGDGGKGRLRVIGDLSGNMVHLKKTVIYGNLICNSAQLNDCIVFGSIACSSKLSMQRSICSTFHCQSAQLGGNNYIFSFGASSAKSLTLNGTLRSFAMIGLEKAVSTGRFDTHNIIELSDEDVHKASDNGKDLLVVHPYDRIMNLERIKDMGENADFIKSTIVHQVKDRIKSSYDKKTDREKIESFFIGFLQGNQN